MKRTALKRITLALLVVSLALLAALPALAAGTVRMSSTIGPIDAGIVPALVEAYKKSGTTVTFEGAGTGATLEKAKTGNFDIVMVHARSLEDKFIADGFGVDRRDIMYNDFVILGPASDPAGIKGMKSAASALTRIAIMGSPFVTRGDMSGTHVKELEVWDAARIKPEGDWYVTFDHEMNKQHHLGFVAVVSFDRMAVEKLYPEQGAEARLPRLAGAKLYTYCTAHGLMRHEPARR